MARKKKILTDDERFEKLGIVPSKYQRDIFSFILHEQGNLTVKAYAGSGKTFTLTAIMRLIPKDEKKLYVAFNKEIVNEIECKMKSVSPKITNLKISTLHALGFSIIRRNVGDMIEINDFKYRTYIKTNITDLTSLNLSRMTRIQVSTYIDSIIDLVSFGRLNLAQCEKDFVRVAIKYDIPVEYDECKVAVDVIRWGRERLCEIDFTDMIWLPYELSMNPRSLKYDWILVDESQDLSPAQLDLVLRCNKAGTRMVFVGDPAQAINGFAGSDEESFDKIVNLPNMNVLPLPISYRCPKKVVTLANTFVKGMEALEDAVDGEILHDCKIDDIKDGDMVLCRTKTPLITLYMKFLSKGVTSYIRGKDIGLNLIKMLEASDEEELNEDLLEKGVFSSLYQSMFKERNRMMEKSGIDMNDATMSYQIMERYDSIKALITLSNGLKTKTELIDRVSGMFGDENEGICLSTVHKAKGLEADNIFILCNSLMPSKLAVKDWEIKQEMNLIYVAYTRPKKKLCFVSEKEISPFSSMFDDNSLLTELRCIEKMICRIYGTEMTVDVVNPKLSKLNIMHATDIDSLKKSVNSSDVKTKRKKVSKLYDLLKRKEQG